MGIAVKEQSFDVADTKLVKATELKKMTLTGGSNKTVVRLKNDVT